MGVRFDLLALDGLVRRPRQQVGQRVGHSLAHVWGRVRGALLNRHQKQWANQRHADCCHHAKCESSDERVRIGQVTLKGIDREKRKIGLLARVTDEVHVDELLHLHVFNGHVPHDVREEAHHRLVERGHAKKALHAMELLLTVFAVEKAAYILGGA